MITTTILNVIFTALSALTQLITKLPDVTEISGISTAIANASAYIHSLNSFLPMTSILLVLGVVIAYETGYFGFKIIYWIIKRIPTQS